LGEFSSTEAIVIGDADGQSGLYLGQSVSSNMILRWVYNATPANAYASFNTYGYNNPFYMDASVLALQSQSDGNVGIGTTSPLAKLDVAGVIRSIDGTDYISLDSSATDPTINLFRSGSHLTKLASTTNGLTITSG